MSRKEITAYMVSRGWKVTHDKAECVQLSRENYRENMSEVYATQDSLDYVREVAGEKAVRYLHYPHYDYEIHTVALMVA
jgi:hypothetical protein